jgi:hypothetical protein
MDLLHKLRSLLGALAHKPFAAGPEKAAPQQGTLPAKHGEATDRRSGLGREISPGVGKKGDEAPEEERVADLIEQQKLVPERSKGEDARG